MLIDDLKARLRPEEAFVPRAYRDSRGILTVAYGFNLERPDADAQLKKLGLSPTAVRSGSWPLTIQQGEELLDYDARCAITDASDVVGHETWLRLPLTAQLVLADMCYNMGAATLETFRKMLAAIRQDPPNWLEMERQMQDSDWDKQVGRRADALEHLILTLVPSMSEADRARAIALLIPSKLPAGAHAGDQDPEPPQIA